LPENLVACPLHAGLVHFKIQCKLNAWTEHLHIGCTKLFHISLCISSQSTVTYLVFLAATVHEILLMFLKSSFGEFILSSVSFPFLLFSCSYEAFWENTLLQSWRF